MYLTDEWKMFVRQAYKDVSFYSQKLTEQGIEIDLLDLDNEWERLPLVEKSDFVKASDGIIMPNRMMDWFSGRIGEIFTSGSTGSCLKVLWSMEDAKRSLLPLWVYRKRQFGILPSDRFCYFFSSRAMGKCEKASEEIKNQMGFSKNNLSEERLMEIYDEMLKYEPVWLQLQPVIATLLVGIKKKHMLSNISSLRYIEMTGEMLPEALRRELEETFKCTVANQYGANEVNSIAYECKEGKLHCLDENVIVEIVDDIGKVVRDGKEGHICVTSLQNRTMPFLRYMTGDKGYFLKDGCACGRRGKCLCLTGARELSWIRIDSQEKINPYVLLRPIENVNRTLDYPIMQFQIVQKDYLKFTYKIIAEEEMHGRIVELLMSNICEKSLAGSQVEVEFCEFIFPDESGKLKWFVSEM